MIEDTMPEQLPPPPEELPQPDAAAEAESTPVRASNIGWLLGINRVEPARNTEIVFALMRLDEERAAYQAAKKAKLDRAIVVGRRIGLSPAETKELIRNGGQGYLSWYDISTTYGRRRP